MPEPTDTTSGANLVERLRPNRRITGMSAILLPFTASGEVDWSGFEGHVERTLAAGLAPAVNMDTGYVQSIDPATRSAVLQLTGELCGDRRFVAGAFVADAPGDAFNAAGYTANMSKRRRAKLADRQRTADGYLKIGGDTGPAMVPGRPDESALIEAVRYANEDFQMPPKNNGGKMPDAEIATFFKHFGYVVGP